jgi:hypothetical protein
MANEEGSVIRKHASIKTPDAPERIRDSDFVSVYANQSQVTSSPFDFRLTFSEMQPDQRGEVQVHERVAVVMAPMHAKALHMLLGTNIQRHEQAFGEINIDRILKLAETAPDNEENAAPPLRLESE